MDERLTARERRLYARLFALAQAQQAAATRLDMGLLGSWGRMRLRRRQQRLEALFHAIVAHKIGRVGGPRLHDAIKQDIEHCAVHWPDAPPAGIAFARRLARRARGFVAPDADADGTAPSAQAGLTAKRHETERADGRL